MLVLEQAGQSAEIDLGLRPELSWLRQRAAQVIV